MSEISFAPNSWIIFFRASLGFLFTTKQLKLKQQRVWVIAFNRLLTVPQAMAAARRRARRRAEGVWEGLPGRWRSLESARVPKHRPFFLKWPRRRRVGPRQRRRRQQQNHSVPNTFFFAFPLLSPSLPTLPRRPPRPHLSCSCSSPRGASTFKWLRAFFRPQLKIGLGGGRSRKIENRVSSSQR